MTGAMINDKERFVCVWEEGGGGGMASDVHNIF